ncbi:hypothetical protein HXX76_016151, partial [Chlamydomonas incerta]
MRGRQVAPAQGSAHGRVRPFITRRCVQVRADANGNNGNYGNGNNGNNDPANNPLANGVSPNYRVPYNTNVNAAPRALAPFLTNRDSQPSSAITPAIEGNFKATGRTVVITGGSQGVGRATALVFARKGYNVVVAAREPTRLQHVVDDCAAAAGRVGAAMAVPCDITNERREGVGG